MPALSGQCAALVPLVPGTAALISISSTLAVPLSTVNKYLSDCRLFLFFSPYFFFHGMLGEDTSQQGHPGSEGRLVFIVLCLNFPIRWRHTSK